IISEIRNQFERPILERAVRKEEIREVDTGSQQFDAHGFSKIDVHSVGKMYGGRGLRLCLRFELLKRRHVPANGNDSVISSEVAMEIGPWPFKECEIPGHKPKGRFQIRAYAVELSKSRRTVPACPVPQHDEILKPVSKADFRRRCLRVGDNLVECTIELMYDL